MLDQRRVDVVVREVRDAEQLGAQAEGAVQRRQRAVRLGDQRAVDRLGNVAAVQRRGQARGVLAGPRVEEVALDLRVERDPEGALELLVRLPELAKDEDAVGAVRAGRGTWCRPPGRGAPSSRRTGSPRGTACPRSRRRRRCWPAPARSARPGRGASPRPARACAPAAARGPRGRSGTAPAPAPPSGSGRPSPPAAPGSPARSTTSARRTRPPSCWTSCRAPSASDTRVSSSDHIDGVGADPRRAPWPSRSRCRGPASSWPPRSRACPCRHRPRAGAWRTACRASSNACTRRVEVAQVPEVLLRHLDLRRQRDRSAHDTDQQHRRHDYSHHRSPPLRHSRPESVPESCGRSEHQHGVAERVEARSPRAPPASYAASTRSRPASAATSMSSVERGRWKLVSSAPVPRKR